MIINESKFGLKGQHILAQGKRRRSVALGRKVDKKIVVSDEKGNVISTRN
jgi:hypothetical protein